VDTKQLAEAIEAYLDKHQGFDSLADIYPVIADICREKADHVRSSWQDEGLAHLWERYGNACDSARNAFEKAQLKID
jgi:predicted glycoside hydrolase/deacetylase ChbG (UPF0249 family)